MADDIKLIIGVDDRDLIRTQKEQKKFERNLLIIEAAFRKGDITSKRYSSELNKQAKSLSKLGGSYKKANSEVRIYASAIRKATDEQLKLTMAQNQAGKSTNRFGMYAQQVGYQVGDFFVQVQSGTSALVAFGQQGTQLAGLLPGVLGAVVGISLAVGTMLLRSFMQASGEAKSLADAMETTQKSLDEYISSIDIINDMSIQNKFGSLSTTMQNMARDSARFAENMMFKGLDQAADKLSIASKGFFGIFERFYDRMTDMTGRVYSDMGGQELSELKNLDQMGISEVVSVEIYKGFINGLKEAASSNDAASAFKIVSAMSSRIIGPDGLSREGQKNLNTKGQEFVETLKEQMRILEQIVTLEEKLEKSKSDNHEEEKTSLAAQITLLKTAMDFGRKSDTFLQTSLNNKVSAYAREKEALFENNQLTRKQADALVAQFSQIQNLEIEEQNRIRNAKTLADELNKAARAMQRLGNFGNGIGKAIEVATAKLNALKTGGDSGIAGRIAAMRSDVEARTKAALAANASPSQVAQEQSTQLANIKKLEALLTQVKSLQSSKKIKKASSTETGREAVEKLIAQAKHKRGLISLSDEQARREVILFNLQKTNASKREALSDKEILDVSDQIHAINEQTIALKKQKAQQEQIASIIADRMGGALMDIASGTISVKEAFRSMAADIIKELYKVLVVQKIVAAAKTAMTGFNLFSADGSVISNGSQVTAYANGGIVGSPTTFAMSGGRTGLMGEAGPEAIMPLKRGSNGKLGVQMEGGSKGGDNVVIHQNFNFQANGDDTVKKLIAQAAPKIMSMTKTSLIEDRRRGGSTKAAFG